MNQRIDLNIDHDGRVYHVTGSVNEHDIAELRLQHGDESPVYVIIWPDSNYIAVRVLVQPKGRRVAHYRDVPKSQHRKITLARTIGRAALAKNIATA